MTIDIKQVPECPNNVDAAGKSKKIRKKSDGNSIFSRIPFLLKFCLFVGVLSATAYLAYKGFFDNQII